MGTAGGDSNPPADIKANGKVGLEDFLYFFSIGLGRVYSFCLRWSLRSSDLL